MCYSAQVEQHLKKLGRKFGARVDYAAFASVFRRRVTDASVKVTKALEANFYQPETAEEHEIKQCVDLDNERRVREWEVELFAQKKRLADAQRKLKEKSTKKALNDERVATAKIAS